MEEFTLYFTSRWCLKWQPLAFGFDGVSVLLRGSVLVLLSGSQIGLLNIFFKWAGWSRSNSAHFTPTRPKNNFSLRCLYWTCFLWCGRGGGPYAGATGRQNHRWFSPLVLFKLVCHSCPGWRCDSCWPQLLLQGNAETQHCLRCSFCPSLEKEIHFN